MKKGKYFRHSLAKDLDIFVIKILSDNLHYLTLRVAYISQKQALAVGMDIISIKKEDLCSWTEVFHPKADNIEE